MLKRLTAILVLGTLPIFAFSGMAEEATTTCDSRESVLKFLSTKYAEAPVAMGVSKNGSLVEVLTSGAGSTFTIIVTRPDGKTCMVAAGQGWETLSNLTRNQPRI